MCLASTCIVFCIAGEHKQSFRNHTCHAGARKLSLHEYNALLDIVGWAGTSSTESSVADAALRLMNAMCAAPQLRSAACAH